MTPEHRAVQRFCAMELLEAEAPLAVDFVAEKLGLAPERVGNIVGKMRRAQMLLLDDEGRVNCVYPVRNSNPPDYVGLHRLRFSDGRSTELP